MDSAVFASASSLGRDPESLVADLARQVREQLGTEGEPGPVDLAAVFLSTNLTEAAASIASKLRRELAPAVMLGCTAEGVIGRLEELEGQTGVTLVAGRLPGVKLTPFFIETDAWRSALFDYDEFRRLLGAPADVRLFILLGDPFSTPMDDVLEAFNNAYPNIPVIGGMASAGLRPMGNALILNDVVSPTGAVGVALSGPLEVHVVVSQGCRPVGRPFSVTHAHKNMLLGLEDRPPLAVIHELISELSEEDQELLQNGLFVGRAINSEREDLGRGDFVIRGITGIDRESGAIAIADNVVEGEKIQFHLRDALTAQEDLEMLLIPQSFRQPPDGALLFSCNGRGRRLYNYPNGDIAVIQKILGGAPLAGFFAAGEIGPVGGKNFVHSHTASLAVFRMRAEEP